VLTCLTVKNRQSNSGFSVAHAWETRTGDGISGSARTANQCISKASGSFVVGSIYDVKATRPNGQATMHGHPVYTGMQSEDDDLIDSLSAKHRAAEETIRLLAKERAAKRDDPVELAIARLCDLAANVPAPQRGTFAHYVTYRLTRSWE
jgi:hypothetical protein